MLEPYRRAYAEHELRAGRSPRSVAATLGVSVGVVQPVLKPNNPPMLDLWAHNRVRGKRRVHEDARIWMAVEAGERTIDIAEAYGLSSTSCVSRSWRRVEHTRSAR